MRRWIINHMNEIIGAFFSLVIILAIFVGGFVLIDSQEKYSKTRGQEAYSFGVKCKQYGMPSTANPFIKEQHRKYCWLQGWSETECPEEIEE